MPAQQCTSPYALSHYTHNAEFLCTCRIGHGGSQQPSPFSLFDRHRQCLVFFCVVGVSVSGFLCPFPCHSGIGVRQRLCREVNCFVKEPVRSRAALEVSGTVRMSDLQQQQRSGREEEQPNEVSELKFRVQLLEGEVRLLLLRNLGIHGNLDGLGSLLLHTQAKMSELESKVSNLMNHLGQNATAGQNASTQRENLNDDSVFLPVDVPQFPISMVLAATSNSRQSSMFSESKLAGQTTASSVTQDQASGALSSRRRASESQFPLPPPPQLLRIAPAKDMELNESDADQPSSGAIAPPPTPVTGGISVLKKPPVAKKPRKSRAKGGGSGKRPATTKSAGKSSSVTGPVNAPADPENDKEDSPKSEIIGEKVASTATAPNGEAASSQGDENLVGNSKKEEFSTGDAIEMTGDVVAEIGEIIVASEADLGITKPVRILGLQEMNAGSALSQVLIGSLVSKGRISNATTKTENSGAPGSEIKEPSLGSTVQPDVGNVANTKQQKSKRSSGSQAKREPVKKIKIVSNGETLMIAGTGPAALSKAKKSTKGNPASMAPPLAPAATADQADLQVSQEMYRCTKCTCNFPSELELDEHMELHKIIGGNDSDKVALTTGSPITRGTASVGSRTPEFNYSCSVCFRGFKTQYHLQAHSVVHSSR